MPREISRTSVPVRETFWWWNIVVTVRQLVLVFCLALSESPERQVLLAILVCSANAMGVIVYRPYRAERCNMCEALGQLFLLALVLTGLLNPTDITLADSETLRFPNDSLVTFTMLVQGSISALFAISLVRQDIAESQLMAPYLK
jgi:hypothetical protein